MSWFFKKNVDNKTDNQNMILFYSLGMDEYKKTVKSLNHYKVKKIVNIEGFRKKMKKKYYNIVITGTNIKDVTFIKTLRNELYYQGIIISLTDVQDDKTTKCFEELGVNKVLVRPVTNDDILHITIDHALLYKLRDIKKTETKKVSGLSEEVKDLIVDDSDPNREVLTRYLKKHNRNSDTANNGKVAIEKIGEYKNYKIVWMDIQMPKMNGLECTKYLREVHKYSGYIIGVTGHVDAESVKLAKEVGMTDLIAKPIDKQNLALCIEQYG